MLSARDRYYLSISLHDVAPSTWPACSFLLRTLDRLGIGPVTLLVVPDYHYHGSVIEEPSFCRAIDRRLQQGDEVALHGFFHLDEGRGPRGPEGWLRRRVLTAGEGEFSALPVAQAHARLEQGLAILHACGWPVYGFIAPAWQLGLEARIALTEFPFTYTTTRTEIWALPSWRRYRATSLVYSVRSQIRRRLSWYWNEAQSERQANAPLLRVSLHPADAAYPEVMEHWRQLLAAASKKREAITKHAWVMQQA